VHASSLDAFAAGVLADVGGLGALPAISAEIGDTWIHGVASDPLRGALPPAAVGRRCSPLAAIHRRRLPPPPSQPLA